MPLDAESTLLQYRLVEKLGEGGMGVVWKAVDTSLGRDVAIKVLPEAFARDTERLARLEREARLLASINHPNIASVFGLHESDGTRFLAMEFVRGEDLQQRLKAGALPLDEALPIASQIAEALEAAHEQGVVHRDLKPANVKVTPEGKVKVLDFGLAKAFDAAVTSGSGPTASSLPTVAANTAAGVILGTARYMSPEQARGKVVDRRADIWAFGCILYEMLTGRYAFEGETATDALVAVMTREPDWEALPAGTPERVRELLRRCLTKDPRRRLRDIGDARIALDEVRAAPEGSGAAPIAVTSRAAPRHRALWWAVAGALLLGLAAGTLLPSLAGRSVTRPTELKVTRLTDLPGIESHPSISPDGDLLAYTALVGGQSDIFVQRVGGRNAVNVTADSTADDSQPAFSPDGQRIAFRSERDGGGIFVMGSTGESVRRLTDFGYDPAWSPDGRFLALATEPVLDPLSRQTTSELWVVDVSSEEKRRLYAGDAVQPRWSPHGQRIAFAGNRWPASQHDLWTIPAKGLAQGEMPVSVTEDVAVDWDPVWSPDGRFLYFGSGRGGTFNLWRVAIDEGSGRPRAAPEPVTTPSSWSGFFSITRDGRKIAYMAQESSASLERLDLDPNTGAPLGPPFVLLRTSLELGDGRLDVSPDGQWIVSTTGMEKEDIVVVRSDGTGLRHLTDDPFRDRGPRFSPDGKEVIFFSDRGGGYQIWTVRLDGSGLRQVTTNEDCVFRPTWSPDGRRLATSGSTGSCIREVDASGKLGAPHPLPNPAEGQIFMMSAWSPDGRLLAGQIGRLDEGETILYDVQTQRYDRLGLRGSVAGFLPDGRGLIIQGETNLIRIDLATRRERLLLEWSEPDQEADVAIGPGGHTLYLALRHIQADIWLAELN